MEIPRQVEEAAELATQMHERMFNPDSQTEDQKEEPQNEEVTPDEEPSEETDVPHDDDIAELRKFKERYLSLKGKYDAEVPRLHSELKEFKQSVFDRLSSMAQPEQKEETKPAENERLTKFREEYGDDFVETIKELLRTEVDPLLKNSIAPVQDKVSSVEDAQIKAAQQNFVNYVTEHTKGDWQKLWSGQDPKFIEFLQQSDPSGLYTYGDLVKAYNDNWDADRLTKVFNTYFESTAPPVKQEAKPNPVKDAMIAPSRNTTHTTPATSDKRIWTKEVYEEFQREDRKGKYSSEESMAMWNDLLVAANEGRLRF